MSLEKFDNTKPIYLFTLNKNIQWRDYPWNTAGLINHSCDNNCDYEGKGLKIWVTSIRDIKKDEEITADYGLVLMKIINSFVVNELKNCCGTLLELSSRWRINKKLL